MPQKSRRPEIKASATPAILVELDSLLEAFGDADQEEIEFRLDALTTMFLEGGFLSRSKLRRLKFHNVIEGLVIDLPRRDALAEMMETFEDLINAYGDVPSDDEINEAKVILEKVVGALKAVLEGDANKGQLNLDLNQ
jgi:hypothetical protein